MGNSKKNNELVGSDESTDKIKMDPALASTIENLEEGDLAKSVKKLFLQS